MIFSSEIILEDIKNAKTIEQLMVYKDLINTFSEMELSNIEKIKIKQEIEKRKIEMKNE